MFSKIIIGVMTTSCALLLLAGTVEAGCCAAKTNNKCAKLKTAPQAKQAMCACCKCDPCICQKCQCCKCKPCICKPGK